MLHHLEQQLQNITYGDHLCTFCEPDEQITQAVHFILKGLSQNNQCLYIADSIILEKTRNQLALQGINNINAAKENLLFKTTEEYYLKSGKFDKKDAVAFLKQAESEALRKGFNGLWIIGDANFILDKNISSNDFIEYESSINEIFSQTKTVIFCQYNHALNNTHINDIIVSHPMIMMNSCLVPNPFYQHRQLALHFNQNFKAEFKHELALWQINRLKHLLVLELEKSHLQRTKDELDLQFRQLVENINDVFWIRDLKRNKYIYISPNFEKIWGLKTNEVFDDPYIWINAIHVQDRERIKMRFLQEDYKNSDEKYRVILPNKKTAWVRERTFLVKDNLNQDYRVVGFLEDISKIKNLEEQFYHAQKFDSIGKLAGGIAHDFNNLLAIILSNTGHLLSQQLQNEQKECVEEISKTAHRAAELTKQLLLFGRKKELITTQFNLNEEVESTAKMLQQLLGQDITFQQKLANQPLVINADRTMIDQILLNLTTNARDAMPNGGLLIIETNAVELDELSASQSSSSRPGQFACLTVSDSGTGIPQEILPKIFDPFFTTKEVGKGSGLGLATVYSIVEQLQGWIEVYSEAGTGTKLHIYLPLTEKSL